MVLDLGKYVNSNWPNIRQERSKLEAVLTFSLALDPMTNAKESLELGLYNLPRIQIINLSMKCVRRVDS